MDAIRLRTVETFVAGLRDIVDHALGLVALLLTFFMVLATVLVVVTYRLTMGLRRGPAAT